MRSMITPIVIGQHMYGMQLFLIYKTTIELKQ